MKRALAILVLALVLLSLSSAARADSIYQASWDTMAGFNGGTKTTVDTATDSCLASGQGFQLNATGGNYGVTPRCPQSSPRISAANLTGAYDMKTLLPNPAGGIGLIHDFSPASINAIRVGAVAEVTDGPFGKGVWLGASGELLATSSCLSAVCLDGWTGGNSPTYNMTWGYWVKGNWTADSALHTLSTDASQGSPDGYYWNYIGDAFSNFRFQYGDTAGGTYDDGCGPFVFPARSSVWVPVVVRFDYHAASWGHKMDCWIDGVHYGPMNLTVTAGRTLASLKTEGRDNYIGSYAGGSPWKGSMAMPVVFTRWLSNSEAANYSKIGTYAFSGFWSSPDINVTNQRPEAIALGFRNQTGFSYVQSLYIFNASDDSELWHTLDISFATGDSNVTYVVLPAGGSWPRGNVSLYLTIGLTGTGNGTAQVFYIAMVFASLPTLAVALPSDITTWLALLFLLIPLGLLWVLALYLDRRWLLLPAGIITFLLGFFAWTELSAFGLDTRMAATISLVAVGVVTLYEGIPGED